MKLVVGTFLTLDGVMQAPGAPDEDRSGGFAHGGWMVPFFDDALGQAMTDWCTRAEALLLGRRTYEIFAAHWPYVDDPADAVAATFNRVPKCVASHTLEELHWHGSYLIKADVVRMVAALREAPGGELQVHGSGVLVQTLLAHDLVDELRLWIAPLLLGEGKRLFGEGTRPLTLRLAETQTVSTGAMLQVYRRDPLHDGAPQYGSFALPEPTAEELARRMRENL